MNARLTLLASAAFALSLPSLGQAADRSIVILQSITGVGAFVGAPASEGMKFAAEEINATGFLGADKLKVTVVDDASDRGQAIAAITRAAQDPDVLLVLGPTISPNAIAGAAVANELKIVSYSMTLADAVLKAGPWSFIAAQVPDVTMPALADYVIGKMNVKSCVSINISDNEAYVVLARVFREYAEKRGVKFLESAGVKQADSDFSAISTRVVAAKPECVLFFTTAPVTANLAIQLKQAGLDPSVKLIGHTGIASPALIKIGGAAVEGMTFNSDWVPGGATPAAKAFVENYKKAKNVDADNWSALGYSYMYVMANAIKNAGANPTRETVRDAVTKTKDVPVVIGNGKYSLDANRWPLYGISILTVKNGQFVQVE